MQTLRVQYLAGFGLEVPDVAVAEHFYSTFGLAATHAGSALCLQSGARQAAEIVVLQGREKRLHHLSFAIRAQDLPAFGEHLLALGTPPATPPWGEIREGPWFQDPWGTWINLTPTEALPPIDLSPTLVEPRVDRHLWQELPRQVRPNRLGHMLMFTQDWEKTEKFYCAALGLRTSDRAAGKVAFMAAGAGVRDHHCFGLINSTHRGFQHGSFHVDSIDEIGFGALQMYKAGYRDGFGVGRHALASNLFHYTRDPWGSWIEYYADMDKISENWQTRDWNDLPYI